jgi:hypothetical protein
MKKLFLPPPPLNDLKVFIGTWNVNAKNPSEEQIKKWFNNVISYDIIAIGIQEIVPLNAHGATQSTVDRLKIANEKARMKIHDRIHEKFHHVEEVQETSAEPIDDTIKRRVIAHWKTLLENVLNESSDQYSYLNATKLFGLVLFVYIKSGLKRVISEVHTEKCGVGIMGSMANKGAAALRLTLNDTSFCFVSCHLAAGENNTEDRNVDFNRIITRIRFQNGRPLLEHDRIFFFGDMNYRLHCVREFAEDLFLDKKWAELRIYDQLNIAKKEGKVFQGFSEGELDFAPSYKYDVGKFELDSSDKHRVPSYCDRILWKCVDNPTNTGPSLIQLLHYKSHSDVLASDHLPVSASFSVYIGKSKSPSTSPRTQAHTIYSLPQPPPNFALRRVTSPAPLGNTNGDGQAMSFGKSESAPPILSNDAGADKGSPLKRGRPGVHPPSRTNTVGDVDIKPPTRPRPQPPPHQ